MEKSASASKSKPNLHISVTLDDQVRESETRYRIKRSAPLKCLMREYATRFGVDVGTLRFLYDGLQLKESDTAKMLELEDGAVITVFSEQVGGRGATAIC